MPNYSGLPDNWAQLTPAQKREYRLNQFLNPADIPFVSPDAAKAYKVRAQRLVDVFNVKEPDRVPISLPVGNLPFNLAGVSMHEVMYDVEKGIKACNAFNEKYSEELEYYSVPFVAPGQALEILDYKLYAWPGHGLSVNAPNYQFVEGEYMKVDEYDKLIQDPTDYYLRTYMPRQADAFAPLAGLPHLNPLIGIPVFVLARMADPEIQKAYLAMFRAGEEIVRWQDTIGVVAREAIESGYPGFSGGMSGAPFDMLTDMMRGMHGIVMDMYRRPEKIHEALNAMTPIVIEEAVESAARSMSPVIMMPLHKGDKTFMSDKQYETFYWPTFKKVLMGLIDEGLVPMPFAEGNYIPRLETIQDMPEASMIWYFEYMDMARAKATVGKKNTIAGNLPISIMVTGTSRDVKEGCRKLIETCAAGGGYILSSSATMDQGNIENLHAMMDAAREYGIYKK
jgi:hypothetical protein